MVHFAAKCQTRHELEDALGRPEYALRGDLFRTTDADGKVEIPDLAESYADRDCVVEIWFRDGRVMAVTGFVRWSAWDLASGLAQQR